MDGPTNPVLLVDGDILVYRCGFAAEKTKYLVTSPISVMGGESHSMDFFDSYKEAKEAAGDKGVIWSRKEIEPVENALANVKTVINSLIYKFNLIDSSQIKVYLTGKGNFRDAITTSKEYKDNRDPTHRPKHYRAIKDFLIKNWKAEVINGEEADDAIGRAAATLEWNDESYVVVSNDKDLDQIPGWHYDWTKNALYRVAFEDAVQWYFVQLLCGDATDNIPGIMSENKARDLLKDLNNPERYVQAVVEAYKEKFGKAWRRELDAISRLVWIRKADENPPFMDYYAAA